MTATATDMHRANRARELNRMSKTSLVRMLREKGSLMASTKWRKDEVIWEILEAEARS